MEGTRVPTTAAPTAVTSSAATSAAGTSAAGTSAGRIGLFGRAVRGIRLQYLLFVAFTLVAAIPVVTLDLWQAHTTLANEIDSVRERHLLVARNLTSTLSRYVTDVKAAFEVTLASGNLEQKITGLNGLLVSLDFTHICVLRADGSVETDMPGLQNDMPLSFRRCRTSRMTRTAVRSSIW